MKFVTKKIHALIDYPVALALIFLPFIIGLGESGSIAIYASVITGVAALLLTFLTDHQTGVIKLISYKLHLIVDFVVGLTFVILPFVLDFHGLDFVYYLVNGLAVLFVVGLHKGETSVTPSLA